MTKGDLTGTKSAATSKGVLGGVLAALMSAFVLLAEAIPILIDVMSEPDMQLTVREQAAEAAAAAAERDWLTMALAASGLIGSIVAVYGRIVATKKLSVTGD